jgi:hypothetical protein
VSDAVVIEVKIDGSFSEAARQVVRYSALPRVKGVILAASNAWMNGIKSDSLRKTFRDKPIRLIALRRQSF